MRMMVMIITLFKIILVSLLIACCSKLHAISEIFYALIEPNIDAVYFIPDTDSDTELQRSSVPSINVPLRFEVRHHNKTTDCGDSYRFCFILSHSHELSRVEYKEYCVPTLKTSLSIYDLSEGDYLLSSYIKQLNQHSQTDAISADSVVIPQSVQSRRFQIVSYRRVLPIISYINSDPVNLVPDLRSMQAEYVLEYQFIETSSLLPLADFVVCLYIMNAASTELIVTRTCTTQIQSAMTLRHLPIGKYHIHSYLRRKTPSSVRDIEDRKVDEIVLNVTVMQLDQIEASRIIIGATTSEFVADSHSGVADIVVPYQTVGPLVILRQLHMCIVIQDQHHNNDGRTSPVSSCQPSTRSELTLSNIKPGVYILTLFLAVIDLDSGEPMMQYPSSEVSTAVTVQLPSEFIPSYDWKPLHAWHTIPSGIETRYAISYHIG